MWKEVEFTDLQVNDQFKVDIKGCEGIIYTITKILHDGKEINYIANHNNGNKTFGLITLRTWQDNRYKIFKLITSNLAQQEKPVLKPHSKWAVLEAVFGQPNYRPKRIPDHPHKCPFCNSAAYVTMFTIDCTGNCEVSRQKGYGNSGKQGTF